MAITPLGVTSTQTASGNGNIVLPVPTDLVGGNLLATDFLLAIMVAANSTIPDQNWSEAAPETRGVFCFKRTVGTLTSGTNITFPNSNGGFIGGIAAFRGVDLANPIDVLGTDFYNTNNANTYNMPSVTSTVDDGLLVAYGCGVGGGLAGSTNWNGYDGMTELFGRSMGGSNNRALAMAYEQRPTAGATGGRTLTTSNNASSRRARGLILNPAPVAPLGRPYAAGIVGV